MKFVVGIISTKQLKNVKALPKRVLVIALEQKQILKIRALNYKIS